MYNLKFANKNAVDMIKRINDHMSKGLRKMGLAASQARFLSITARKADCEYKSTDLAQQKLEITNQLSDISTQYASAMNATKLMWANDAVSADYGLTYSLLMTPSAMNDFNPYFITSPSGALILNTEYAAAAKAAGISKAGGIGSQTQRDKFISALVPGGILTDETAKSITKYDYVAVKGSDNNITFSNIDTVGGTTSAPGVAWNPIAGMGSEPLNKASVDAMTFADLVLSESVGKKEVDWGKVLVGADQITKNEYEEEVSRLQGLVATSKNGKVSEDILTQLKRDKINYQNKNKGKETETEYINQVNRYDELISNVSKILAGQVNDKEILNNDGTSSGITITSVISDVKDQLSTDLTNYQATAKQTVNIKDQFNTDSNSLNATGPNSAGTNVNKTYTVVQNGVINHYKDEIESISIGDILSGNIVLMSNKADAAGEKEFKEKVIQLFDSIVRVFGYSKDEDLSGQGLNVDDASKSALKFAYTMTVNSCLKQTKQFGNRVNGSSMTDNSAYLNAVENNRIGKDSENKYMAVSLSNILSSFLTYYDNALMGVNSNYVVGESTDTSIYVTEDRGYKYIIQDDESAVTKVTDKSADFFDELYNNLLEHGWREDAAIDDSEYLEAALKDGRYSMSSLNKDGYYYQTRYNETGYMVEVSDTDAIARAEAEFTSKKAELTYKEDSIDMKSKKLDLEISTLSTEYETVKGLISKSIEKTFAMFSN